MKKVALDTPNAEDATQAAVCSLLASTEALQRALMNGEDDLVEVLEARGRAFAQLRETVQAPLQPPVRALVERVLALDRSLLAQAEGHLNEVRAELARARRSRVALRSLEAEKKPPRFFSERA